MSQLITTSQAAELLGVTPGTLRNWRWRKKKLPYVIMADGRTVRYEMRAINKYIENRTKPKKVVEVDG